MSHQVLATKFNYYNKLSAQGQERFRLRVEKFRRSKEFIGRAGLVITDEIEILISASAIQLTFGLSDYIINHLHTINVFPHVFYLKQYDAKFKGLTTKNGVLALSWIDFKEGYRIEKDKINLGLHELAHALHVDIQMDGNRDSRFSIFFDRWERFSIIYLQQLQNEQITFLRKYGAHNMHELFAVSIEHFFEAPDEFKIELPELYAYLAHMLNQDPVNHNDDFIIDMPAPHYNRISLDPKPVITGKERRDFFVKKHGVKIAIVVTFIGLFAGIPFLMWIASITIINTTPLLIMLFVCGCLGLLKWRYVKDVIDMRFSQFAMYSFAGFGICLINLLFFINYAVRVSSYTDYYYVKSFEMYNSNVSMRLYSNDFESGLERSFNHYIDRNFDEMPNANRAEVTFDKGLLGLYVVDEMRFYQ